MIRPYDDKDLEDLLDSWYQASLVATPFLDAAFLKKERNNIEHTYIPNTKTWVYEEAGKVVGFVAMIGNEVGAIFLQPTHQGKGIGAQLMNHVAQFHPVLEVEVFKENKIGRAFYDRYGFVFMKEGLHEETGQALLRLQYNRPRT